MGVCAFVASGLNFDVESYLLDSPFKAKAVFRKGEIPPKGNPKRQPRPDSGFAIVVNEDQRANIEKALVFLIRHEKELNRLRTLGVDNMLLDFGVEVGDKLQKSEYLPPDLIAALGRCGMGLIVSAIQLPHE